ncbi:MAG: transglycosylase SLT domain-containing protein [Desulfobacter sp.]|nr:transglycosylase SLT domain-containing protein [Desulfobacter sp.]WDP86275.1 MAG: transglycosylase SLT domain-containing protein [Desulfobacter sp.]
MSYFRAIGGILALLAMASPLLAKERVTQAIVRTHIPQLSQITRFTGDIRLCGLKIPYEDAQVRERLEKEVMLAAWNRPQVLLWLKRSQRYFFHIEKILKQENLPQDLKYVPVVESALRPHSRSGKGAVGYWQFLKSTGTRYGLRIDKRVDERRNLFKSTRAACLYLKKLHQEFGSYFLALAAYNMGEFGLDTGIQAQGTRDFFSLYLPLETQRYLLKIVAAKLIIENPEAYGFHLMPQDLYPVFSFSKINFSLNREVPLSLIARSAGISFKTLKDYNPEIRGYYLEGKDSSVLVPKEKEKGFKQNFTILRKAWEKKVTMKFHVVMPGESLIKIAKEYKMPLAALLRLNKFSYQKVIHPGDRLRVR